MVSLSGLHVCCFRFRAVQSSSWYKDTVGASRLVSGAECGPGSGCCQLEGSIQV